MPGHRNAMRVSQSGSHRRYNGCSRILGVSTPSAGKDHMTNPSQTSRRDALRMLAGVPLIPVIGFTTASGAQAAVKSAEFISMAAPATPEAQATTTGESALVVTYDGGTRQPFKLGYRPLFITGDQVPDGSGGTVVAGGYHDITGKPIMDASGRRLHNSSPTVPTAT